MAANLEIAFATAATTLPARAATAKRPWISQTTLDLIDRRNSYRHCQDYYNEQLLNRAIRRAGREDKRMWMGKYLVGGSWEA
eukprot:9468758-Pyramimonas_sp.AAC.1